MGETKLATVTCQVCKQQKAMSEVVAGGAVRESVVEEIRKDNPDWSANGYICNHDLDHYRMAYVQSSLTAEKGEMSELEAAVVKSMKEQELLSKNMNDEFDSKLSFGERIADRVAEFGGSWNFIIIFAIILVVWIAINSYALFFRHFDPFPFILLNLGLSGLAAFQAPIIMMSQNRQESKDRMRAEHDYQVNLKAELEIRTLSEKMDHLLHTQWQRLMEIQQIQTDLMEELACRNARAGVEETPSAN